MRMILFICSGLLLHSVRGWAGSVNFESLMYWIWHQKQPVRESVCSFCRWRVIPGLQEKWTSCCHTAKHQHSQIILLLVIFTDLKRQLLCLEMENLYSLVGSGLGSCSNNFHPLITSYIPMYSFSYQSSFYSHSRQRQAVFLQDKNIW